MSFTDLLTRDTIVIDTETGNIYEVEITTRGIYRCHGLNTDHALTLDEWNYNQHFKWNLFKFCNYG